MDADVYMKACENCGLDFLTKMPSSVVACSNGCHDALLARGRQVKNTAETPRPFEDRRVLYVAVETLRGTRDALASVIESAPKSDAKLHIKDAFGDVVLAIRCLERALAAL